jgi:uncharacterized protein (TIGR00369 family)
MQAIGGVPMGQGVLAQQPFSQLLGSELTAWDAGHCTLELPLREALLQNNGFAHGGVVCYLADNAITFAGSGALQAPAVTSEFKVNYVRPAVGDRLIARAEAVAAGKTQAVCRCDVFAVKDGVERLCAVAQGTIVKVGA